MIKKIVAIGPESTGKSILCKQLAEHFKTVWAEEYARTFLEGRGAAYDFDDLYEIAKGQIKNEEEAVLNAQLTIQPPQLVFIDTDLYVVKVWSEFVYNKCDNRILTQIATRKYDLYLLCNTDIPWIKDSLREYPDLETRKKLFEYYKDAMLNQYVPWIEIKGKDDERLQAAIEAVDSILSR